MRYKILGKEQANRLDFSKEIDFDSLADEEYPIKIDEEKLERIVGGDDEYEPFPCPCGGTYYLLSTYARSYCYQCNKCGKSLVFGLF